MTFIDFEIDALCAEKMPHKAAILNSGVENFGAKMLADDKSAKRTFELLVEVSAAVHLGEDSFALAYPGLAFGGFETGQPTGFLTGA